MQNNLRFIVKLVSFQMFDGCLNDCSKTIINTLGFGCWGVFDFEIERESCDGDTLERVNIVSVVIIVDEFYAVLSVTVFCTS